MSNDIEQFEAFASGERLREELKAKGFTIAADGMVIINAKGIIAVVNDTLLEWFWYTEDELLGDSVDNLLPETLRVLHSQHRAAYVDNPVTKPMGEGRKFPARRKDGKEFEVVVSINRVPHRNEMFFMATLRRASE